MTSNERVYTYSESQWAELRDYAIGLQKQRDELREKLKAVTKWLEKHQPDVFRRGLWDAIGSSSDETTTKLEELLRDVAANGKRNWSIAAHRQLVRMGLVGSPEEPHETADASEFQRLLELRNAALDAWEVRFPEYVWRVTEGKVDLRIRPVEPQFRSTCPKGHTEGDCSSTCFSEEPHETTVSLATYESAVKGRSDFRQAYKQARSLLRQFIAAWEGQPNHENMDRLCEVAREIAGSSEEPSPVLDHRFIPEGMDPGICQKCGATRASHRDTREGIVFAEKAAESSPDQLVGALQDRVHQDLGRVRAGRSVKASGEHVHEWHPLPRGVNFCVTCDAVFKPLFGVDLAPGESRSGWMCTKHGVINGPDCDKCKQGSEEPKHGV